MVKKVVVIGAGFSGLYAVKKLIHLARAGEIELTLVSRRDFYLGVNKLMELAGGRTNPDSAKTPIKDLIKSMPVSFINEEVSKIDLQLKKVFTSGQEVDYDYLILSTGFKPKEPAIEGAADNTVVFNNFESALEVKKRIENALDKTANGEQVSLNFSIIGGGVLAVGLALEIRELIDSLIEKTYKNIPQEKISVELFSNGTILDYFSEAARAKVESYLREKKIKLHLKAKILKINDHGMQTDNGYLECGNIFWIDGLRAEFPELVGSTTTDVDGKINVNNFLQLEKYSDAFIIGGSSTGYPILAYVKSQAEVIALNIEKLVSYAKNVNFDYRDTELHEYSFEDGAKFLMLGRNSAVLDLTGSVLMGGAANFMWKTFLGKGYSI